MLAAIQISVIAGTIFTILYSITALGLALVVISENRNPLKTISWVVVLLLVPGLGLIFYFFFGQDNRRFRIISRRTYKRIMKGPQRQRLIQDVQFEIPQAYAPLVSLLKNTNRASLLYGTDITVYTSGTEKFKSLFEDIEKARQHIHIQYYIVMDDETGMRLRDLLIAKAKEGVAIRLLYDDVGSWDVKKGFFREMRQHGIEVYPFLKVAFPAFTSKVNYRNHRKITVIDGEVGYIGGMNVADRYVKGNDLGCWRDTHLRLAGKGVHGLQSAFLIDWYVVSKQLFNSKAFYPPLEIHTKNIMQIVTSGPTGPWRTLLQATIYVISNAKKYVYIQTPYFLPTEGLNQALQIAALGGVDVRLMIPRNSDTKSINLASRSYLDDMLRAGIKVYFYTPGFLHAKMIVSDDILVTAGSANMDFRSFEHNFEVNAYIYGEDFALEMKKIFKHDMQYCEHVVASQWFKRPFKQRVAESFMRLFSPLL